ncbi:hypothetical protein BT93_L0273 [Corymbia citriodora subsp. variegata]|uniref:Uncharacterized protein n=1 Tax=Corymbia citriodora subsp. variegata TaxID=360336 RepID=A0A8T0CRJ0_CORYI|nr:hypothetical protein BT93_L0273 [Corymbia citriodora subsp. variegata]
MRVLDEVLKDMRSPAYLLNDALSFAKRQTHLYLQQRIEPKAKGRPHRYGNYSHQRLPGLPDTWNQLFLRALFDYFFTFIMYTYWQLQQFTSLPPPTILWRSANMRTSHLSCKYDLTIFLLLRSKMTRFCLASAFFFFAWTV